MEEKTHLFSKLDGVLFVTSNSQFLQVLQHLANSGRQSTSKILHQSKSNLVSLIASAYLFVFLSLLISFGISTNNVPLTSKYSRLWSSPIDFGSRGSAHLIVKYFKWIKLSKCLGKAYEVPSISTTFNCLYFVGIVLTKSSDAFVKTSSDRTCGFQYMLLKN